MTPNELKTFDGLDFDIYDDGMILHLPDGRTEAWTRVQYPITLATPCGLELLQVDGVLYAAPYTKHRQPIVLNTKGPHGKT